MDDNVCRLCVNFGSDLIQAFDKNKPAQDNVASYEELANKIAYCLDIKVSQDDKLSKWICTTCFNDVSKYYKFKKQCKAAEIFLMKYKTIAPESAPAVTGNEITPIAAVSRATRKNPRQSRNNSVTAKPTPPTPVTTRSIPTTPVTNKSIPTTSVTNKSIPTTPVTKKSIPTTPVTKKSIPTTPVTKKSIPTTPVTNKSIPTTPVTKKSIPTTPVTAKPVATKQITPKSLISKPVLRQQSPPASEAVEPTPVADDDDDEDSLVLPQLIERRTQAIYECLKCNQLFNTKEARDEHMNVEHLLRCTVCTKICKTGAGLKHHMRWFHKPTADDREADDTEPDQPISCDDDDSDDDTVSVSTTIPSARNTRQISTRGGEQEQANDDEQQQNHGAESTGSEDALKHFQSAGSSSVAEKLLRKFKGGNRVTRSGSIASSVDVSTHDISIASDSSEAEIACQQSSSTAAASSSLFCKECNIEFDDEKKFRAHVSNLFVHPLVCGICQRSFKVTRGLKSHLSMMHKMRVYSYVNPDLRQSDIKQEEGERDDDDDDSESHDYEAGEIKSGGGGGGGNTVTNLNEFVLKEARIVLEPCDRLPEFLSSKWNDFGRTIGRIIGIENDATPYDASEESRVMELCGDLSKLGGRDNSSTNIDLDKSDDSVQLRGSNRHSAGRNYRKFMDKNVKELFLPRKGSMKSLDRTVTKTESSHNDSRSTAIKIDSLEKNAQLNLQPVVLLPSPSRKSHNPVNELFETLKLEKVSDRLQDRLSKKSDEIGGQISDGMKSKDTTVVVESLTMKPRTRNTKTIMLYDGEDDEDFSDPDDPSYDPVSNKTERISNNDFFHSTDDSKFDVKRVPDKNRENEMDSSSGTFGRSSTSRRIIKTSKKKASSMEYEAMVKRRKFVSSEDSPATWKIVQRNLNDSTIDTSFEPAGERIAQTAKQHSTDIVVNREQPSTAKRKLPIEADELREDFVRNHIVFNLATSVAVKRPFGFEVTREKDSTSPYEVCANLRQSIQDYRAHHDGDSSNKQPAGSKTNVYKMSQEDEQFFDRLRGLLDRETKMWLLGVYDSDKKDMCTSMVVSDDATVKKQHTEVFGDGDNGGGETSEREEKAPKVSIVDMVNMQESESQWVIRTVSGQMGTTTSTALMKVSVETAKSEIGENSSTLGVARSKDATPKVTTASAKGQTLKIIYVTKAMREKSPSVARPKVKSPSVVTSEDKSSKATERNFTAVDGSKDNTATVAKNAESVEGSKNNNASTTAEITPGVAIAEDKTSTSTQGGVAASEDKTSKTTGNSPGVAISQDKTSKTTGNSPSVAISQDKTSTTTTETCTDASMKDDNTKAENVTIDPMILTNTTTTTNSVTNENQSAMMAEENAPKHLSQEVIQRANEITLGSNDANEIANVEREKSEAEKIIEILEKDTVTLVESDLQNMASSSSTVDVQQIDTSLPKDSKTGAEPVTAVTQQKRYFIINKSTVAPIKAADSQPDIKILEHSNSKQKNSLLTNDMPGVTMQTNDIAKDSA